MGAAAHAQSSDPIASLLEQAQPPAAPVEPSHQTVRRPLNYADLGAFRQAVDSGRRGDVAGARVAITGIGDSLARKTATWVLVDANADSLSFFELDTERSELAGWPRDSRRLASAEKRLETS
ncbi:MAG: lytic transglycosylase domain-containing protein, partial [Phenylobacterium sp.]